MLPQKLVFSLAAMIAYFKGEANGQHYQIQDDKWIMDFYKEAWAECDGRPISIYQLVEKVLRLEKVWKRDLNEVPNLTISVSHYLFLIQQRSEEHTSELQSRPHLVCRLLLEKKNKNHI